jgi:hypothetical protein
LPSMARIPTKWIVDESRPNCGRFAFTSFVILFFFFLTFSKNVSNLFDAFIFVTFPRNQKRFLRYLSAHCFLFYFFYSWNFQHFVVYFTSPSPIHPSAVTTSSSNRSAPRWARSFASPCAAKDPDSGQHWGAVVSGARHPVTLTFRPTTTFHLFTGFVYELLLLFTLIYSVSAGETGAKRK